MTNSSNINPFMDTIEPWSSRWLSCVGLGATTVILAILALTYILVTAWTVRSGHLVVLTPRDSMAVTALGGLPWSLILGLVTFWFGLSPHPLHISDVTCSTLLTLGVASQWGVAISTPVLAVYYTTLIHRHYSITSTPHVRPASGATITISGKTCWAGPWGLVAVVAMVYAVTSLVTCLSLLDLWIGHGLRNGCGGLGDSFCARFFDCPESFPRKAMGLVFLTSGVVGTLAIVAMAFVLDALSIEYDGAATGVGMDEASARARLQAFIRPPDEGFHFHPFAVARPPPPPDFRGLDRAPRSPLPERADDDDSYGRLWQFPDHEVDSHPSSMSSLVVEPSTASAVQRAINYNAVYEGNFWVVPRPRYGQIPNRPRPIAGRNARRGVPQSFHLEAASTVVSQTTSGDVAVSNRRMANARNLSRVSPAPLADARDIARPQASSQRAQGIEALSSHNQNPSAGDLTHLSNQNNRSGDVFSQSSNQNAHSDHEPSQGNNAPRVLPNDAGAGVDQDRDEESYQHWRLINLIFPHRITGRNKRRFRHTRVDHVRDNVVPTPNGSQTENRCRAVDFFDSPELTPCSFVFISWMMCFLTYTVLAIYMLWTSEARPATFRFTDESFGLFLGMVLLKTILESCLYIAIVL